MLIAAKQQNDFIMQRNDFIMQRNGFIMQRNGFIMQRNDFIMQRNDRKPANPISRTFSDPPLPILSGSSISPFIDLSFSTKNNISLILS